MRWRLNEWMKVTWNWSDGDWMNVGMKLRQWWGHTDYFHGFWKRPWPRSGELRIWGRRRIVGGGVLEARMGSATAETCPRWDTGSWLSSVAAMIGSGQFPWLTLQNNRKWITLPVSEPVSAIAAWVWLAPAFSVSDEPILMMSGSAANPDTARDKVRITTTATWHEIIPIDSISLLTYSSSSVPLLHCSPFPFSSSSVLSSSSDSGDSDRMLSGIPPIS